MSEEIRLHIKEKLALVPSLPGSYQMKNSDGLIIYVGKAKNLKNRLKSYFTGTVTGKTLMLVNDVATFEYIITNSELESLILEITLIKKYNPKYNILLKDDKTYPYIELTNEKYPTVRVVRNVNRKKNKSRLFGPYPNVTAARKTVELINRLYPLRKCQNLGKELCLYYHIGECLGYCKKGMINEQELTKVRNDITSFLNGNKSIVVKKLENDMYKASEDMNYERAHELKLTLDDINTTLAKQTIDLNNKYNGDVFSYYKDNNYMSIQVFFLREGILFGRHSEIFMTVDNEEESFLEYIIKFYEKNSVLPKEIIVPNNIDASVIEEYLKVKVHIPKKGDLKKVLDMARDNARMTLEEKEEIISRNDKERTDAIDELRTMLGIDNLFRTEIFDNSHLFGTFYVGGMVVFDNFLPNKNLYRKYKISMEVKDDLAAMREVLYRRYFKVLMEKLEKPDLIIVDGGILQVNIAREIINSLNLNIKIIGLKKDDKHRTNSIIDDNGIEHKLDIRGNLFIFLTKMQEEVHNYAINYHRNIKSKGMLSSLLDLVDGIGVVRKKELLKKFGSLKKMKEATIEELEEVLSHDVAINLFNYLKTV